MADLTPEQIAILQGAFGGSGGSGGSSGETFGPMTFDASIGKYVQIGSRGTVRVVADPAETIPQGTDARDLNSDGLDDRTGNAVGVYSVPQSISPTGWAYGPNGTPVYPNGAPYTGAGSAQVPGWSNQVRQPDGIYGINDQTGRYELIPGSETLGTPATQTSGPTGGSGGGGGSAYGGLATQMLSNQGALARIEAESAAQRARDQAQADLQKSILAQQQGFTGDQNARDRALTAAQYAASHGLNRQQAMLSEKQYRRGLTSDYMAAVSSVDPSAFLALFHATGGNIGNLLASGESAISPRSLYGATQILNEIRSPMLDIPEFVWTENGYVPATSVGAIGAPGGSTGGTGATGGTVGGSGGAGGSSGGGPALGSSVPFLAPDIDMVPLMESLRAAGATDAEIAELQAEIASGKRSASDFMLSDYYRSMTGNPNFLRAGDNGTQMVGPNSTGSGQMSNTWQTTDPFGQNYAPHLIPQPAPAPTMGGTGTLDPGPMPANHPLAGGLTGGVTADALGGGVRTNELDNRIVIPGYATGTQRGLARGIHIVGDPPPGSDSPNPEMIRWTPQGNQIVPLRDMRQARGLMRSGVRGYAAGTLSARSRNPYGATPTQTYTSNVTGGTAIGGTPLGGSAVGGMPTYTPTAVQTTSTAPAPVPQNTGGTAPSANTPPPTPTTTVPSTAPPPVATQPPVDPLGNPTMPATVTPEDQATMDEILRLRELAWEQRPADYNVYAADYFARDPLWRAAGEAALQAGKGISVASTQAEAQKFRLRGLGRSQMAQAV